MFRPRPPVVRSLLTIACLIGIGIRLTSALGESVVVAEGVGKIPTTERQALGLLHARCEVCHSADLIIQQRLDREKWTAIEQDGPLGGAGVAFGARGAAELFGHPLSSGCPTRATQRQRDQSGFGSARDSKLSDGGIAPGPSTLCRTLSSLPRGRRSRGDRAETGRQSDPA